MEVSIDNLLTFNAAVDLIEDRYGWQIDQSTLRKHVQRRGLPRYRLADVILIDHTAVADYATRRLARSKGR